MGSRSLGRAESAIEKLPQDLRSRCTGVELDVTDANSLTNAFKNVSAITPALSLLINNAGILGETDSKEATLATNYFGVISCTTTFLPLLKKGVGTKTIIATSSSCGVRHMSKVDKEVREKLMSNELTVHELTSIVNNLAADTDDIYSVTKLAANMHTRILARELANENINAVAVSPGFTNTDMCNNYTGDRQPKEVPLGASVFHEALFGVGKDKTGIFIKQNSEAGTPLDQAKSKVTDWQ